MTDNICPPAGGRTEVTAAELAEAPLLVVPERLFMTTEQADALLVAVVGGDKASTRLPLQLPAPARLAMLLAHEAGKGGDSPWGPYVAALPERGPCAWLMDPQELRVALRPLLQQGRGFGAADRGWRVRRLATSVIIKTVARAVCRLR